MRGDDGEDRVEGGGGGEDGGGEGDRENGGRGEGGGGDCGGGNDGGDEDADESGEWGFIPSEILAKTTPIAVWLGLSHDQHMCLIAAFLHCCGVQMENFAISHSTAVRRTSPGEERRC